MINLLGYQVNLWLILALVLVVGTLIAAAFSALEVTVALGLSANVFTALGTGRR